MATVAIIESFYIYNSEIPRKGLEFLFIIPLIFAFCIIVFGKTIIPYQRNGIGLKVYYAIIVVRYLLQPILLILSKGELNFRMPEASPESYPVAIFIYWIELTVACVVIRKWFPIYSKKFQKKDISKKQILLNFYGKAVIIVFFLFFVLRYNSWISGLNILGLKEASSDVAVVFESTIFNCLKVFIFIYFLFKAKININNKVKFKIYFFLGLVAGIFNFTSYFGSNRSFIYETAIATITILIYSYPQFKKKILIVMLPIALCIMFFTYMTKQFAVENISAFENKNSSTATANIVEEYANGLWTVARSYQASIGLSTKSSVEAFIKDISDGFSGLNDLPGFSSINQELKSLRSSSDIFKDTLRQEDDRGQMLSLSGGFLIIGGEYVGWVFVVLGNYLMIMLLVYMEVGSKSVKDLYYKYMYIWMSILMGLVHCYCLQTIVFSWSRFILIYWLVLFVNKNSLKRTGVR